MGKSSREKETKRGATVLHEAVYTCKQERKEIDESVEQCLVAGNKQSADDEKNRVTDSSRMSQRDICITINSLALNTLVVF